MKISEIITDKYKLRIPPTVYYELLADVVEAEEEQEPCEDCISKKSVLEIFGYVMDYWKEHAIDVEPHEIEDALIEQYEFTAKQLSDLPPVTPQPKMGRWINQHVLYANATIDFKVCSECRYEFSYDAETGVSDANYCPKCGTKMKSEVEE